MKTMKLKSKKPDRPSTEGFVIEAAEVVLSGVQKMIDGLEERMNKRFDKQDNGIKWIKNDVNDLNQTHLHKKNLINLKEE